MNKSYDLDTAYELTVAGCEGRIAQPILRNADVKTHMQAVIHAYLGRKNGCDAYEEAQDSLSNAFQATLEAMNLPDATSIAQRYTRIVSKFVERHSCDLYTSSVTEEPETIAIMSALGLHKDPNGTYALNVPPGGGPKNAR